MEKYNYVDLIALLLLAIGGLNWGLVGLFNFDLVAAIFGLMTPISKIIYTLVGLSGVYMIYYITKLLSK